MPKKLIIAAAGVPHCIAAEGHEAVLDIVSFPISAYSNETMANRTIPTYRSLGTVHEDCTVRRSPAAAQMGLKNLVEDQTDSKER